MNNQHMQTCRVTHISYTSIHSTKSRALKIISGTNNESISGEVSVYGRGLLGGQALKINMMKQ